MANFNTLSSRYEPSETEQRWYSHWLANGYFQSKPDPTKTPFTIVIPPPNVTGVLHMGHMLNNTIQDVLIRRARMQGFNACWVPGTDHASIATEAKVVRRLREQGIKKSDLSRDAFLSHAWQWKEEYGGVILEQLKKLGASCDWSRTRFTMDERYAQSVNDTFLHLHKKGLLYRGLRMVHWDCEALTAVSDEEVIYTEEKGKMYRIRYAVEGSNDALVIATTRPETIMADSALCVHPADERYSHFIGRKAIIPLINRAIPIIADEYVDREFGTGCLKVTPAHDANDFALGQKHGLDTIDILTPNGQLNELAMVLVGCDRFEARKKIESMLADAGALMGVTEHVNKVGRSERTNSVIEPRLSKQWFVRMGELAAPALAAVESGEVKFHPERYANTYRHWMTNIKDWCISRQLWWGHQIPAWYVSGTDDYVVAANAAEALDLARAKFGSHLSADDLNQDEDVVDTWFSSWLWPISVFDGFYTRTDLDYYYPTSTLVTGPDIIFFWVARMVMAGYEFEGKKPFTDVYFTGIIRDKQGRKMSKQLGNSPDPVELIEKYSADGVRLGLLMCAPAGNDIPFDEAICEQGRNFANKIWNALRLVKGWQNDAVADAPQTPAAAVAVEWMHHRINSTVSLVNEQFAKYRLSEAATALYRLVWDEFCSFYLEAVKPAAGTSPDLTTVEQSVQLFEKLMQLLHPIMPFITEEVWHQLADRQANASICVAPWPAEAAFDQGLLNDFEVAKTIVTETRALRASKGLSPKAPLVIHHSGAARHYGRFSAVVEKLANAELMFASQVTSASSFIVGTDVFNVPMETSGNQDQERAKLEADKLYEQGFLKSVMAKLSNERFTASAPTAVVEAERQKERDARHRIATIEAKLGALSA